MLAAAARAPVTHFELAQGLAAPRSSLCAVKASAMVGPYKRRGTTSPACGPAQKALLRLVRNRRSIENYWHWVRDVAFREDAHRYRETNGVQIVSMLPTMAINSLRLNGIWSVSEGIAALAHDIKGLLRLLGWREPAEPQSSG